MPELKGKDAAPGTGLGPRKPIRRQIQKIVMLITLAALLFTSAVGFFSMLRIRNESEKSLKLQLEQNALDYGILTKAEESGLKRLTALFQTFGFGTVKFSVKQVEPVVDQPADDPVETGEVPVADTTAA